MARSIIEAETDLVSDIVVRRVALEDELTTCKLQIEGMHRDIYQLLLDKVQLRETILGLQSSLDTMREDYIRIKSDYLAQKNRCSVLDNKLADRVTR